MMMIPKASSAKGLRCSCGFLLIPLILHMLSWHGDCAIIPGEYHLFETGKVVINTTDATWTHSYEEVYFPETTTSSAIFNTTPADVSNTTDSTTPNVTATTESSLNETTTVPPQLTVDTFEGSFTTYTYQDGAEAEWSCELARFRFNGTVLLRTPVEIVGENPLSVESESGDVEIRTTLNLDADNGPVNVNFLGGYAEFLGPGAGISDRFPGGGGHGGKGGGWVVDVNGTEYGKQYGTSDTDGVVVLGGSAGGVSDLSEADSSTYARGGGSIYIKAAHAIIVDKVISARGQSANQSVASDDPSQCAGGGSGGRIRLEAAVVEFGPTGVLDVGGGDGSFLPDNGTFCGQGGGGGVIDIAITGHAAGRLPREEENVIGGGGYPSNGENGFLTIQAKRTSSGGGNGGKTCPPVAATTLRPDVTTDDYATCVSTSSCDILQLLYQGDISPYDVNMYLAILLSQLRETETLTLETLNYFVTVTSALIEVTPVEMLRPELDREVYIKNFGDVLNILSNLVDQMDGDTRKAAIETTMNAIEAVGRGVGEKVAALGTDAPETVSLITDSFVMEIIHSDSGRFRGLNFPDRSVSPFEEEKWKSPYASIEVPQPGTPEGETVLLTIVSILYANLAPSLPGILIDAQRSNDTYQVHSRVISSSIFTAVNDSDTGMDGLVNITLELIEPVVSPVVSCGFWNFTALAADEGAWSSKGCQIDDQNETHVTCTCNHLTNFAVLLQLTDTEISETDKIALELITYIGCSLSLFGLLLSILTLSFCFRGLNYECASINMNLMISLGIANIAFLAGADATWNPRLCTGVAMLLHYVYLAAFMWMLVEGTHLYLRVTKVFSTGLYLRFYYPAAYGLPAIVVGVTAGVNIAAYGNDTVCWLSVHDKSIWAFAGPALFIILANVAILVVVMHTFLAVKSIAKKPRIEQAKRSTRAALVLLPLLGITWLFGCLAFNNATIVFQYVFAILNSLQGFFIFIFHCIANDEVRKTFTTKVRRTVSRDNYFKQDTTHHSISHTVKKYQTSPMRSKTSSIAPSGHFVPGKPIMDAFNTKPGENSSTEVKL